MTPNQFKVILAFAMAVTTISAQNCVQGTANCGAVVHDEDLRAAYNDPQSMVAIPDSRPIIVDGSVRQFTATIKNLSQQDVIAFEVLWQLVLDNDGKPTATASRDMIFSPSPIAPGGSLTVTSYVGGWPLGVVRAISGRVSYYQLRDRSEFDSHLTRVSGEFRERRAKAAEIFRSIQSVGANAGGDKAIGGILSDPMLAKDTSAGVTLMELKGLFGEGGGSAVLRYVNGALDTVK